MCIRDRHSAVDTSLRRFGVGIVLRGSSVLGDVSQDAASTAWLVRHGQCYQKVDDSCIYLELTIHGYGSNMFLIFNDPAAGLMFVRDTSPQQNMYKRVLTRSRAGVAEGVSHCWNGRSCFDRSSRI